MKIKIFKINAWNIEEPNRIVLEPKERAHKQLLILEVNTNIFVKSQLIKYSNVNYNYFIEHIIFCQIGKKKWYFIFAIEFKKCKFLDIKESAQFTWLMTLSLLF